ncbi:hypothetical protein RRG08_003033 [Elysia crispata]|uniref:Uncharacterized protein n=1 Tax=Elysia crispata TaxID=231223 RepID=A0AAE1EAT8_9GAST|nr:hypothetical protein RRG08_003033 [Elysia crispata]
MHCGARPTSSDFEPVLAEHIDIISGVADAMTGYFSKLLDLGYSGAEWLGCSCRSYHARYSVVHENPRVSAEGVEHDDVRRLAADERYDAVSPVTVRLRNKQRRLSEAPASAVAALVIR